MFQSLYFSFLGRGGRPAIQGLPLTPHWQLHLQTYSFFDSTGRDESDWIKHENTYCPLRDGCHAVWAFPSLSSNFYFLFFSVNAWWTL